LCERTETIALTLLDITTSRLDGRQMKSAKFRKNLFGKYSIFLDI